MVTETPGTEGTAPHDEYPHSPVSHVLHISKRPGPSLRSSLRFILWIELHAASPASGSLTCPHWKRSAVLNWHTASPLFVISQTLHINFTRPPCIHQHMVDTLSQQFTSMLHCQRFQPLDCCHCRRKRSVLWNLCVQRSANFLKPQNSYSLQLCNQ